MDEKGLVEKEDEGVCAGGKRISGCYHLLEYRLDLGREIKENKD